MIRSMSLSALEDKNIQADMITKGTKNFSHYTLFNHKIIKYLDKQALGLLTKLAQETNLPVGVCLNCMVLFHFADRFAEYKVSGQLREHLFVIGKNGQLLRNADLFNYYYDRSLASYEAAIAQVNRLEKSQVPADGDDKPVLQVKVATKRAAKTHS